MASAAYQRAGHLSGLSTGLTDLDNKLGGLQSSDLIILAGRPSMGKTALATNIAYNIAKSYRAELQPDGTMKAVDGAIVGFFSLEMSAEQLATRILSEQAEIGSEKIRRGMINEDEFRKLVEVSRVMSESPLYIDQTGGISIAQLAARARKLKRQKGLGVLDRRLPAAAHRLVQARATTACRRSPRSPPASRRWPRSSPCRSSRCRSSRARSRTARTSGRSFPTCAKSGSIEQDADVVMFVFREEYYVERLKPSEGRRSSPSGSRR